MKLTRLARLINAKPTTVELNEATIQKWRKDLLLFLRNIDTLVKMHNTCCADRDVYWRATDQEREELDRLQAQRDQAYQEFRQVADRLRTRFDRFFLKDFLERSLPSAYDLSDADVDYWKKALSGELRSVSDALRFMQPPWKAKGKKIELQVVGDRLRRAMQSAWKTLGNFLLWYKNRSSATNGPQVPVNKTELVDLLGFKTKVVGYDHDNPHHREYLEVFQHALKVYKQRAAQNYPPLLKQQRPFILSFAHGYNDFAATYEDRYITINVKGQSNPQDLAKTLAHEMGHHLFHTLDSQTQRYWTAAMRANEAPIDLRDILDHMPPEIRNVSQLAEKFKKTDPLLAIRLEILSWPFDDNQEPISTREDLNAAIESGQKVFVPKIPITPYASKNPQEAFCEALSLLVIYGPRTVHPLIQKWLKTALPDLRAAKCTTNRFHLGRPRAALGGSGVLAAVPLGSPTFRSRR